MSEGINFADDHARAVVLIGIPYPAYKDTKVEQKKAYNDHKDSQARGLVTGSKWYNLQAFRAMNQVRICDLIHFCLIQLRVALGFSATAFLVFVRSCNLSCLLAGRLFPIFSPNRYILLCEHCKKIGRA